MSGLGSVVGKVTDGGCSNLHCNPRIFPLFSRKNWVIVKVNFSVIMEKFMSKILPLAIIFFGTFAGPALADKVWTFDEADKFCKTSANGGPGCCSVANDSGNVKIRGNGPVCTCGAAILSSDGPITMAVRLNAAKIYPERYLSKKGKVNNVVRVK